MSSFTVFGLDLRSLLKTCFCLKYNASFLNIHNVRLKNLGILVVKTSNCIFERPGRVLNWRNKALEKPGRV